MAYLWRKTADDEWKADELCTSVDLTDNETRRAGAAPSADSGGRAALRLRCCGDDGGRWVLLATPALRPTVNDEPVEAGIRVLADRDAIRAANLPAVYFSGEQPPRAAAYPDADPVFCPRCKLAVERGRLAVRCPRCRVWHHHSDTDASCWLYAGTCALCDQPTDLERAEFAWTPEEL